MRTSTVRVACREISVVQNSQVMCVMPHGEACPLQQFTNVRLLFSDSVFNLCILKRFCVCTCVDVAPHTCDFMKIIV